MGCEQSYYLHNPLDLSTEYTQTPHRWYKAKANTTIYGVRNAALCPTEYFLQDLSKLFFRIVPQPHGSPGDESVRSNKDTSIFLDFSFSLPVHHISYLVTCVHLTRASTYQSR